jgi:hypothetical protein
MKKNVFIFSAVVLLAIIGVVCADLRFDGITGSATSQPTNVTVQVTGVNPAKVVNISIGANFNPTEDGYTTVTLLATLSDPDGVQDLNDSNVAVLLTKTGETTRENLSCAWVADISAYSAVYSCTVIMWYWDGAGNWTVNVSGTDIGNGTVTYNDSQKFTYNQLKAMTISPDSLTWPTLAGGSTNQNSNNDPTIVNNTGNYNGTIKITGLDLLGDINSSHRITAGNFTAGPVDLLSCTATQLVNNTATTIASTAANPGNLSLGGGEGQEEIYYCRPNVPVVFSQTYSTSQGGRWTIAY